MRFHADACMMAARVHVLHAACMQVKDTKLALKGVSMLQGLIGAGYRLGHVSVCVHAPCMPLSGPMQQRLGAGGGQFSPIKPAIGNLQAACMPDCPL